MKYPKGKVFKFALAGQNLYEEDGFYDIIVEHEKGEEVRVYTILNNEAQSFFYDSCESTISFETTDDTKLKKAKELLLSNGGIEVPLTEDIWPYLENYIKDYEEEE